MRHNVKLCIGIIIFSLYLVVVVGFVIGVLKSIRTHHYSQLELEEIPLFALKPAAGTYDFHIQFCPDEFGKVQAYLDCRAKVLAAL